MEGIGEKEAGKNLNIKVGYRKIRKGELWYEWDELTGDLKKMETRKPFREGKNEKRN